jgi:hypothetical protein
VSYGENITRQYTAALATKIHRGQMGRVLRGYATGGRPFGYKNVAVEDSSSPKDGKGGRRGVLGVRLEVVESEAAVVRRIFAMFADDHSAAQIAKTLNEEKIPASRLSWNPHLARRILRDEKYRGTVTWNKTKRLRNPITSKVEVRLNPSEEVVRVDAPPPAARYRRAVETASRSVSTA